MNDDELMAPMDPELRALLRKGADPGAPAGAEDRVHARLALTLPLLPSPGGGGGGGAAAAGATSKLAAIVAASLIAGGGIGAAITTAVRPAEVRVVYVDRPAPSIAAPVMSAAPEPTSARVEDLPAAASAKPSLSAAKPAASDSPLNAERALLNRARTSFARGDNDAALGALNEHGLKYPQGVLAEEREALAVRTLAALGRTAEAGIRARRFAARYPESLMLPAVLSAIGIDSGAAPP